MFASWESGWGLEAVQALAAARGPLGDALAQALHFGGGTLFFLVVLPIIYWSLQRELGTRLIFALTFSFALGELVKAQFGAPRPVDIAPTLISPLVEQGGFGFPSNHVLLTVAVWGYLAFYLRRRWVTLAVALLVLAQMWGRVYAGVHFPHDVIGGLMLGGISLWLFVQALEYFPSRWARWPTRSRALFTVGSSVLVYLILPPGEESTGLVGLWLGCGLGLIIRDMLAASGVSGSAWQRLARTVLGLTLLIAFFYATRALFGSIGTEGTSFAMLLRLLRYAMTLVLGFVFLPRLFLQLRLTLPIGSD